MEKVPSQWDFGELFKGEEQKKAYSVSELTARVRKTLESRFESVRVVGEVCDFRARGSGHLYFGLKDGEARLACVLFRGARTVHRAAVDNGVELILEGELTVYEPRGQYQLVVCSVEVSGSGALHLAFERLKKRLAGEGLFSAERKRPIPRCLFRLGVVTSARAAALRDVLQVARRRHPALEVVLCSCRVQGEGAAAEIAAGVRQLNRYAAAKSSGKRLEAVLLTRGGGSLEDLWAFNEEVVVRTIAASRLPVISAVGHEVDFTISDFVADLRAPTPSAAAELLTEGVFSSREFVVDAGKELGRLTWKQLRRRSEVSNHLRHRLSNLHPRRLLNLRRQRLDDFEAVMGRVARARLESGFLVTGQLARQLSIHRPAARLKRERERIRQLTELAAERVRRNYGRRQGELDRLGEALRLLSPLNVLERGYSITRDAESGRLIASIGDVKKGGRVATTLRDGKVISEVKDWQRNEREDS